jgi:hypothetical protein
MYRLASPNSNVRFRAPLGPAPIFALHPECRPNRSLQSRTISGDDGRLQRDAAPSLNLIVNRNVK